jgi:hypothetical protein
LNLLLYHAVYHIDAAGFQQPLYITNETRQYVHITYTQRTTDWTTDEAIDNH